PTEMTTDEATLTGKGAMVATFQYMAPEQLEGKEADPRTDIFALGEVIYEMTTARPAFSGKSRASLIAAILTADPPLLRQLQPMTPPTLERVVKKCLAKDPEDRWQSASDLASELKWSAESPSSPIAAEPPSRQTNWGRICRLLALGVLAMAVAFVLGMRWQRDTATIAQFEVNPPPKTYFNFRGLAGPPAPS